MNKFAPLALAACLGIAAAAVSVPAEAGAYVGFAVGGPGISVAPPVVVYPWSYYHAGPRFYPGYFRYGYHCRPGVRVAYWHGRRWR